MSIRPVRLFVLAGLIAVCTFAFMFAYAGAQSLEAAFSEGLVPSAAPGLLGPINENGRVGWACQPERAARASTWQEAELPTQ